MIERRKFLKVTTAGAGALVFGVRSFSRSQMQSSPQSSLVFDAMGEIRNVYSPELINEILESGLNAITVTLCDPKTFEN